jgi:serine/threonine-protein kinase HipA
MKCRGCYREIKEGYCLSCRKKLFNKARVSSILSFDAPKAENLPSYQEYSKRLSISGVQLKYSLRLEDKKLELCEKGGQYILKPIPEARQLLELGEAPENEHLTMQIAEQIFGINVADNALIYFKDGQPAYITRRFDVKDDGSKYMQEDFAQLTNRTKQTHGEAFKYEGTYEEIGLLIKKYVAAAVPALENFFALIVFNYIISNGDAHLKNFSIFRNDEGEYQLTPAYDLMSTVIHTAQESDTALSLYEGDMNSDFYSKYGYYGRDNFIELARRLSIIEKRAERILNKFNFHKKQIEAFVENSFLSPKVKTLYLAKFYDKMKRMELNDLDNNYYIN